MAEVPPKPCAHVACLAEVLHEYLLLLASRTLHGGLGMALLCRGPRTHHRLWRVLQERGLRARRNVHDFTCSFFDWPDVWLVKTMRTWRPENMKGKSLPVGKRSRTGVFLNIHKGNRSVLRQLAEGEGFEPPEPFDSAVFKTAALNHSAIPPRQGVCSGGGSSGGKSLSGVCEIAPSTFSSTKIGAPCSTASAMASLGRESTSRLSSPLRSISLA